jgi:hypothetical protein
LLKANESGCLILHLAVGIAAKRQKLKGFCLSYDAGKVKVRAPVLYYCHGMIFFFAWRVMLAGLSVLPAADAG